MMNQKTTALFTLLFLWGMGVGTAQTVLTLSEAINHALKYKVDAIKAGLDITNADNLIEEARANVLPKVNAQSNLNYNALLQQMALNMGGQTTVIKMGTPWQANSTVQLEQQLFNMSVFQGLKAAKTTKEFYQLNAGLTEEQIIEKVANSYYNVYKTKSQIKTIDQTVANTTRVRNVIAGLEATGLAKKIDLDRINVTLNNLSSTQTTLRNALKLQENSLKYLIGMEIQAPIVLPENTFEIEPQLQSNESFNINNRTEIRLLEKQGQLLALNKKAIEAGRYPSLALTANYGYLSMGDRFPYFAGTAQGVNGSDFSTIALSLKVPLFNGFSIRSKVRQAQIDIDKYQADLADTKLALNLAAENATTQMNNALLTVNSQKSNMDLAKQVLANVENNYKNGLSSLTDLLDAETSYTDAQNNYTAALMDYKLAEIQLQKSKGELTSYYQSKEK